MVAAFNYQSMFSCANCSGSFNKNKNNNNKNNNNNIDSNPISFCSYTVITVIISVNCYTNLSSTRYLE